MATSLVVILVFLGFYDGVTAQSTAPNATNMTTSTPFPTLPPFIPSPPPPPPPPPRASCPNPQLTDNIREIFLDMHNRLRGSIARGQTERNGNLGIAPPAFLMYRMRYDCNAESYAQQHVNTCDGVYQPDYAHPGYKENVNVLNRQSNFEGAAQWAMASWWSQLAKFGIRTDMLFSRQIRSARNRSVRKFTKMAWWSNTRVGCAIRNCGSFIFTSCMYAPGGNIVGQHVYRVGAVCAVTNATTSTPFPTLPPFIPSPPAPPPPPPPPRASCPNPQLTDNIREIFLDMHNRLRGSIARGQTERNGNLGIAPPTSLMYKLRYDCDAESYAQQHVNTCDGVYQPEYAHPGYKENVNVLNRQSNFEGAAQWAMASWWSQLAKFGIRTDMLFSQQIRSARQRSIRKFTKMAWWSNTRVGCAIRNCGSFIFTSCMYAPGGNIVGQHVYRVGAVCAGCPGTCQNGLCPAP
ncbi:hypothetical protein Y032_0335g2868 [Ancylostoma ceylanicum]|uniref:SCP domain-containing protein n=1 Tax=Ancylostoma ceylanicum TaxID=53326 RepID=A0A016RYS9_9BILA|nr:hypothetical protein Y032_0335g2868 [Ancylostoma ceylanicum]